MFNRAMELKEELVSIRRFIHQNPEVHNELPLTQEMVMIKLKEYGLEPSEISKSSVEVLIKGNHPGKTMLLRADMDALPMEELTDFEFKSTNGNMHSCGHDLHTTMLLGAAKLLSENTDKIYGNVKLMFQPAEETLTGAKEMIERGILENPKVDAAMMMHVFSGVKEPVGTLIGMAVGVASTSSDWFDIKINGAGGHGAVPHAAIDPLVVMSKIHLGLMEINAREVDPNKFLVITPCLLQGGTTGNIIPDSAFIQGTIRTFDNEVREYTKKRLQEISISIAKAYRCEAKVTFYRECPIVTNNETVRKSVINSTVKMLGENFVVDSDQKLGGSEDFSYISEKVPSVMFGLVAGLPDIDGKTYPAHHPKVAYSEDALPYGVAIYANSAIEWLKENK